MTTFPTMNFCRFMILVIIQFSLLTELDAQIQGGIGDGYASSTYAGNLQGQSDAWLFAGGEADGFALSRRSGPLDVSDAGTSYKSGDGDGYASGYFSGSLMGADFSVLYGGSEGDGFNLSRASGPIPDANLRTILNCVQAYAQTAGNALEGLENNNIIYQATSLIESTQIIGTGGMVSYSSQEVKLLPGFAVESGAIFEILVRSCIP